MSGWERFLDADLLTLGMAADEARRARPEGGVVTYQRVYVITGWPAVAALEPSAVPDEAGELRLYASPATVDEAVAGVRTLRRSAGERRVSAYSLADLQRPDWSDLPHVLETLVAAGLNDVAELPVDRIADLPAALQVLEASGVEARHITTERAIGAARRETLLRVQQALAAHSVRRYAPLARIAPADVPTTGYDDMRIVALARLALPEISIEVDWHLHGPKLAQVALIFGADHLDGVPAEDNEALGPRRTSVADVERNIRAAGFIPRLVVN